MYKIYLDDDSIVEASDSDELIDFLMTEIYTEDYLDSFFDAEYSSVDSPLGILPMSSLMKRAMTISERYSYRKALAQGMVEDLDAVGHLHYGDYYMEVV